MNDDDNKYGEPPSEHPLRPDSPHRADPLLPGIDTNGEEIAYENYSEESPEEYLNDTDYEDEDEDDSIDYDVDPESVSDDEYEGEGEGEFETEAQPNIDWQSAQLKPELERHGEYDSSAVANSSLEDDDWSGEEGDEEDAPWPIGLIVVAAFALLLLAAGGYGVMQQRAAMQEEIRSLQAVVATSASPQEIASSREDQRVLDQRNTELRATIEALQIEIRTLRDTARGL
jgi:hypothetical protein